MEGVSDQQNRYIFLGAGLVLLLLLLFGFFRSSVSTSPGPVFGTVTVSLMGIPISLTPVDGQDVPCIGAPDGYTRVYFSDDSDESGKYVTVGYAREGDHYEEALSWARSRASDCGFRKIEETSLGFPGAHGTSLHYEKGDNEDLYLDVGVVTGSDGKTYTVVRVGYNLYYEYSGGSTIAGNVEEGDNSTHDQGGSTNISGSVGDWDTTIRPLLEFVFGTPVTVNSAVTAGGVYSYQYAVPRSATTDDITKIVDYMSARGWQAVSQGIQDGHVTIGFVKSGTILGIEYDVGSNKISITVMEGR